VGPGYEFGPSGTQFSSPAQVELHYDDAKLPAGVTPQMLGILAISDGGAKVEMLKSVVVDPSQHAIFGDTSHFTWFAPIVSANVQIGGPGGTPDYGVATPSSGQYFNLWVGPDGEVHGDSNVYASTAPTSITIRVDTAGAMPNAQLEVQETLEDPGGPGTAWDRMPGIFVGLSTMKTDAKGVLELTLDGRALQNDVVGFTQMSPGYPSGRVHVRVFTPAPIDFWISLAVDPLMPR
jgi:hypothetical protein